MRAGIAAVVALSLWPASAGAAEYGWKLTGLTGTATYELSTPAGAPDCTNRSQWVVSGKWTTTFRLRPTPRNAPYPPIFSEKKWKGRRVANGKIDLYTFQTDSEEMMVAESDSYGPGCQWTAPTPCSDSKADWKPSGRELGFGRARNGRYSALWPLITQFISRCPDLSWYQLGQWVGNVKPSSFGKRTATVRWSNRMEGDREFWQGVPQHFVHTYSVTAKLKRVVRR